MDSRILYYRVSVYHLRIGDFKCPFYFLFTNIMFQDKREMEFFKLPSYNKTWIMPFFKILLFTCDKTVGFAQHSR